MDSGNSGSMQSSSGGDEDYNSRAESISAFLNNPSFTSSSNHSHIHMLDTLSNYFDPNPNIIQRSPSLSNPDPLLNLDMAWSKPGRSADLGSLMASSSSSAQNQGFVSSSQLGGQSRGGAFPTAQQSLAQESCSRELLSVSGANDQAHSNTTNSHSVRNPKKRSRASRRAPTTVLTTDTTNFRAMVQEFTGIPAPPFTHSPFPRARLDLFGSSTPSSALRSPHLDPPLPPYLLRPFPHKLHSANPFLSSSSAPRPSFPTTSSMLDPLPSNNPTANSPTSINYQLSSDLGLLKQPPLNVNMHTPILNFQSILQPPPKFPSQNSSSILAPKSQGSLEIPPSADSHLKMGVLEELGLTHAHAHVNANVGGLHRNMVPPSSDGAMTRRGNMGANNEGDDGSLLRSLGGGNYSNAERTNGIVNYLASSDNFHGERGPECVAAVARSEGMVESWINCSSD